MNADLIFGYFALSSRHWKHSLYRWRLQRHLARCHRDIELARKTIRNERAVIRSREEEQAYCLSELRRVDSAIRERSLCG